MNKYAVIVAGGKGLRMGNAIPKQFLPLKGKPVLTWCIEAFIAAFSDIHIILVLPEAQLSYAQIVLQPLPERIDVTLVKGGETRFHSVKNGLDAIDGEGLIFVHDGARPLVTPRLIQQCAELALLNGTAIPCIPAYDSLREEKDGASHPINRDAIRIIQTPQVALSKYLIPAFNQPYQPIFTDEATVLEKNGASIYLAPGEKSNIKITETDDLLIAEAYLAARAAH